MTSSTGDSRTGDIPENAIAVIGMAGRFPGADSVSAFWRNLRDGVESIVDLSEQELLASGVTERTLANNSYVRRAALMAGIENFDAEFFGFTPHAARTLDPQHRLFLQSVFHALEDAGYDQIKANMLGIFFGEPVLMATASKDHCLGTVVADRLNLYWYPHGSKTRPLWAADAYAIYKGRNMLEMFNF